MSLSSRKASQRLCRSAFTLVELLVVIGIIAVLVGILLPTLSKARDQANRTKCASNLRQQGVYLQMYLNMFKGQLPVGGNSAFPELSYVLWHGAATANYYVGMGLLVPAGIVPSDPITDLDSGEGRVFYCPVQTNPGTGYNDTGNTWIGQGGTSTRCTYDQRPEWSYQVDPLSTVTHIWKLSAADGTYERARDPKTGAFVATNTWMPKVDDYKHKALVIDLLTHPTAHEANNQGHKTGINVLWADWNVGWVPIDMLKPMWDDLKAVGYQTTSPNGGSRKQHYLIWKRLDLLGG